MADKFQTAKSFSVVEPHKKVILKRQKKKKKNWGGRNHKNVKEDNRRGRIAIPLARAAAVQQHGMRAAASSSRGTDYGGEVRERTSPTGSSRYTSKAIHNKFHPFHIETMNVPCY